MSSSEVVSLPYASSPTRTRTNSNSSSRKPRPRFIRKVTCHVCGDVANDHLHYGAVACYSCRAFFRRSVAQEGQVKYECRNTAAAQQGGKCEIAKNTRKNCQKCRFDKCLSVGMCPKWVLSEEEKMEKKQVLMDKMRIRRKLKKEGVASPESVNMHTEEAYMSSEEPQVKHEHEETTEDEMSLSEEEHFPLSIEIKARPKLTFTLEERNFMSHIAQLESLSRRFVQLRPDTVLALRESAILGTATPYAACMDGYNVCVKRIEWFMTHLDAFTDLLPEDKETLVRINTHAAVNIKASRMLRPSNGLQKQLTCAVGKDPPNEILQAIAPPTNNNNADKSRISYSQIFPSPWCNDESTEQSFRRNMEDLFESNLDEHSLCLLIIITMLSTSGKEHLLRDLGKIQGLRKGFLKLLHDYLKYIHGESNIRRIFPKFVRLLAQVEDMANVLEHHRLIF